ncbi:MAG: HlyD family efflux transporter periplasmic adaptor subunit, partial [Bacteroidota bacterium]|nr:HlyD family efflux transporter periplasmic adaptor subunit [Bacteroidota bacterium]
EEHFNYRLLRGRLFEQKELKIEQLKIGTTRFYSDSLLHLDGTYSDVQYETAKQNYLNQKSELIQARSAMASTEIEIEELKQEINDLKIQRQEEELNAYARIQESKDKFLGAMADWELKYLMVSPISGQISLSKFWSVNQEVKEGNRVLTIVQEESGPIMGKVLLPNLGAGKVKVGQKVIVRFDRYPHMEFGMVTGLINSISLVPEESNYHVEVEFPDGLTTSYNQELNFTQEMTGQADIITEDRSFLVRIVSPLKSIIKRNTNRAGSEQLTE